MSHLFFVSYARANTKRAADSELVRSFVEELESYVVQSMEKVPEEACFFDRTNIEAGSSWPSDLCDALRKARVGICLYSPSYFSSTWCGKELQVFLDRAAGAGGLPGDPPATAIIPVIWIPATQGLPPALKNIQTHDAAFPEIYHQIGLRQVMNVGTKADLYNVVSALAKRVVSAVKANRLPVLPALDLDSVTSAWDRSSNADPESHKKGGITKTCFIYAAREGWDWRPYETDLSIGAIAQQVSGQLGLKYEEIACDSQLPTRLGETHDHDVPTVLLADPSSFGITKIEAAMRAYDRLYLLNCGLIVPWEHATPPPISDPRWQHVRLHLCPQKTTAPPPYHEWLSTVTPADLKGKCAQVIEGIRCQLLKKILGSENADVLKAESPELSKRAEEEQGLRLDIAPQLTPAAPQAT